MDNYPVQSSTSSIDERSAVTIRLLKCRLCSGLCDQGILVFSDEGRKMCLQGHIKKYLYITITMDDKLTKVICPTCCKTIEDFHNFATMVAQSQCKLLRQAGHIAFFLDQNSINSHKGLLHAYLTKEPFIIDHDYATNKSQKAKVKRSTPRKRKSRAEPKINLPKKVGIHPENELKVHITTDIDMNKIPDPEESQTNEFKTENTINRISTITTPSILEENHTSDSNTHETLEVVLDPLIFLESSSCEDEMETDLECNQRELSINSSQCNICAFRPSSKWGTHEADSNTQTCNHDQGHNIPDNTILKENYVYNNNGDEFLGEKDISENEDEEGTGNADDGKCPICGKGGFSKDNLIMHLKIHRPKGKHECDICRRIFKSINSLTQHKLSHNRAQFQCDICLRVYPTKSTLKAHSITHSDLRPYKCQLCDKSFKRNQDLKFHMNQHTGARPYKCIYCPKAFASSGNCFSHRKRMHPDEVERDRNFAAKIIR